MKIEWTTSELKEALLVWLALIWGMVLLFPGDSFSSPSRVNLMSHYAPDTVWGVLLISVSIPMLVVNKTRFYRFRRFAHIFYWIFWLGITCLAVYSSSADGIQPTDLLICLPFLAIALLHAVIYAGLERNIHADY